MTVQGPYQREAEELVRTFLEEGRLSDAATKQVTALLEDERYIESLEAVLRNV